MFWSPTYHSSAQIGPSTSKVPASFQMRMNFRSGFVDDDVEDADIDDVDEDDADVDDVDEGDGEAVSK